MGQVSLKDLFMFSRRCSGSVLFRDHLEEGFPAAELPGDVFEVLFLLDDLLLYFLIVFHAKYLFVLPVVLGFSPLFELLEIHG